MEEVIRYSVRLFGAMTREVNYSKLGKAWTTAQVKLQLESSIAYLIFYDPDKTANTPTSRYNSQDGVPTIFIPKDEYIAHLDLLRNERPVSLILNENLWTKGSLRTDYEDVGEGDIDFD